MNPYFKNLIHLWMTPHHRAEVITLAILVGLLVVIVIADRVGRRASRILHDRMIAQAAGRVPQVPARRVRKTP